MPDQTISTRALKRLAAEHGETRLLLFDAQEKLGEAQQKIATLEADNARLTTERDSLKATVERLMGQPSLTADAPGLRLDAPAVVNSTARPAAVRKATKDGASHA